MYTVIMGRYRRANSLPPLPASYHLAWQHAILITSPQVDPALFRDYTRSCEDQRDLEKDHYKALVVLIRYS